MTHVPRNWILLSLAGGLAACQPEGDGNGNNAAGNTAATSAAKGDPTARKTISENLAASADHTILVRALKAAGLDQTLAGAGPYTLFAPNDAAFRRLPAGAVETLLKPEQKGSLTTLLTYHIVPGVVTAADLGRAIDKAKGKAQLATIAGGNIVAVRQGPSIVLSDGAGGQARVMEADILQSNGVVHVIDGVLTPR